MSALEEHIAALGAVCAGLPDRRKGPLLRSAYTMADIGLSAFSLFFMGSPSFLAHQRTLSQGQGRSNCQTLFAMSAIPSDNYIRQMLDGAPTAAFDPLFLKAIATPWVLTPFQRLNGRILIALDGTEHHCSRKVHCARCSTRKRSDGGSEYFHSFLGASIVAPGHQHVLPLAPEFIVLQDGAEKQDCERNAAKRWLARHGASLGHARGVFLGDDLFACQPIAEAMQAAGGNFILICKPSSHRTVSEYLHTARLDQHREAVCKRGKRTTTVYRWLADVPLRDSADALKVNWFSVEMFDAKGKRTYRNSFVTDLPVTAVTVAELAACGRARWKIENETFNVFKCGGYNLEHNFGHGKDTLASVLVVLNLLAFAYHTVSSPGRLRLAGGGRRERCHLSLLRALADHHHIRRVPGLGASAPLDRRSQHPTALKQKHPLKTWGLVKQAAEKSDQTRDLELLHLSHKAAVESADQCAPANDRSRSMETRY